jgi:hypothetical protein
MRKITVNRPQKIQLPFSKGRILIDGSEREVVKAGKTATFEIPDGNHDIQVIFAAQPPVNSNVLHIEQSDGDMVFEVKIKVPLSNNDPTYAELTKQ